MDNKEPILPFRVYDHRYLIGKKPQALFASNERIEAVSVAKDAGEGVVVVKVSDNKEKVIYISPYRDNLGIKE